MYDGVLDTGTDAQGRVFRVRLVLMEDCPNPREDYDHFCGALTLPGSGYHDVAEPGALAEVAKPRLFGDYGRFAGHTRGRYSLDAGVEVFRRWVRLHGGITLDRWIHNDGPRVIWYVTPAMAEAAGTPVERLPELLAGEADEYASWAEGDCYGYVVERMVPYVAIEDLDKPPDERRVTGTWEEQESCWGFIGEQYAEAEARAALVPYLTAPAVASA